MTFFEFQRTDSNSYYFEKGRGAKTRKRQPRNSSATLGSISTCAQNNVFKLYAVVQSLSSVRLRLHGLQHSRLPCPSPSPGVCPNSSPLNQWCHPIISSSVVPFSSCLQFSPALASGSFLMSWLFLSGGQSIGASTSTSVLLVNIQGWVPLGLTGLISLKSKGLSRVFSNTTVHKSINSSVLSFL